MNSFQGVGRLTRDPEVQQGKSGKVYTRFSIAIQRDKENADFFRCVAFGDTAIAICDYHKQGDGICVQGSLKQNDYTSKDDVEYRTVEVFVNRFSFVPNRKSEGRSSEQSQPSQHEQQKQNGYQPQMEDDDLPF